MRRVSMREANQNFSGVMAEVEAGEKFIVEKRGKPVAKIVPFRGLSEEAKRQKAIKELFKLLDKGLDLGGEPAPSKDEMHEW